MKTRRNAFSCPRGYRFNAMGLLQSQTGKVSWMGPCSAEIARRQWKVAEIGRINRP